MSYDKSSDCNSNVESNNVPLYCVLTLTILCLTVSLIIVLCGYNSEHATALLSTCTDIVKIGIGAIVGLLGTSKSKH